MNPFIRTHSLPVALAAIAAISPLGPVRAADPASKPAETPMPAAEAPEGAADPTAASPDAGEASLGNIEKALKQPIVSIVNKPKASPTGDPHDYVSYARYWWPNPNTPNGLPYIQKDGHHNREQVKLGDEATLFKMGGTVKTLTAGWSRLHREDCAVRAGEWLRAWFVTPETRMTPNLEYSQIQLGRNHNHGNSTGILDGREFVDVANAITALHGSPGLSAADEKAIRTWFSTYLDWMLTSANGKKEHAAPNNHGSWFLVQAIGIARFSGRDDVARSLCEEDRQRIARQIQPNGAQPEELRRADSLGYSVFNLQAQFEVARNAQELGIDLWNYHAPDGGCLEKALDYLRPFNAAPGKWPGSELKPQKPGFLNGLLADAAKVWPEYRSGTSH